MVGPVTTQLTLSLTFMQSRSFRRSTLLASNYKRCAAAATGSARKKRKAPDSGTPAPAEAPPVGNAPPEAKQPSLGTPAASTAKRRKYVAVSDVLPLDRQPARLVQSAPAAGPVTGSSQPVVERPLLSLPAPGSGAPSVGPANGFSSHSVANGFPAGGSVPVSVVSASKQKVTAVENGSRSMRLGSALSGNSVRGTHAQEWLKAQSSGGLSGAAGAAQWDSVDLHTANTAALLNR